MAKMLKKNGMYLTHNFELSLEESKAKVYTANDENFAKIAVKHKCTSFVDLNDKLEYLITPLTNINVLKNVIIYLKECIKSVSVDNIKFHQLIYKKSGSLFVNLIINYVYNVYNERLDVICTDIIVGFDEYYVIGLDLNDRKNFREMMYTSDGANNIPSKCRQDLIVNGNYLEKWNEDMLFFSNLIGLLSTEEENGLSDLYALDLNFYKHYNIEW